MSNVKRKINKVQKAEYDRKRYAAKKADREAALGPGPHWSRAAATHRMTGSPAYRSWQAMRRRCMVTHDKDYPRYGGRGITVCPEWDRFEVFFADMGERPGGTSIERRDNTLGYCKSNCYWATPLDQTRNRRNAVRVDWAGENLPLKVVCDRTGSSYSTVHSRLFKYGWSIEQAVALPKGTRPPKADVMAPKRQVEFAR